MLWIKISTFFPEDWYNTDTWSDLQKAIWIIAMMIMVSGVFYLLYRFLMNDGE